MRILSLFVLLFSINAFSQTSEMISTGRPGQSIGSDTVGNKIIQLQSGYQYDDYESGDTQTNNNIIRYGIGETFEVSTVFDYKKMQEDFSGTDNLQLGARKSFTFFDFFIQSLAVQLRTRFKGSGDFKRDRQSYELLSSMSFNPIKEIAYGFNFSLSTDGFDTYINKFYALSFSYNIKDNFSFFIEPYGNKGRAQNVISINSGFSYTVTKNLAFDFSVGEGLSNSDDQFVSFGFSVRKLPL